MGPLKDLYQEIILDHNRRPRNQGPVAGSTHAADGRNPLCGDEIHVSLRLKEGRIEQVGFQGQACAIAIASASLMTEAVRGKSEKQARETARRVLAAVDSTSRNETLAGEGDLAALEAVGDYPGRIKCAILAWSAFLCALDGGGEVNTELTAKRDNYE